MADRPDSSLHDADDDGSDDLSDIDGGSGDGRDGLAADGSLTKSDLIELLAREQNHLAHKDVELAVKSLLEKMSQELAAGERIEIRGFGSFSLHFRGARMGRNPKSGDAVALRGKFVPHFKPGKELRERVNAAVASTPDASAERAHDGAASAQRDAEATGDDARD